MARVVVTPAATDALERLIRTHSLPADTIRRVARSLRPPAQFPELGSPLAGRWKGFRFLLGPWRWMVIVYVYDDDRVFIVTIQDARSAGAPRP